MADKNFKSMGMAIGAPENRNIRTEKSQSEAEMK